MSAYENMFLHLKNQIFSFFISYFVKFIYFLQNFLGGLQGMFKDLEFPKVLLFGLYSTLNIIFEIVLFAMLLPLFFLFSGTLILETGNFPIFRSIIERFYSLVNDEQILQASVLIVTLALFCIKFIYSKWLNRAIIRYCQKNVVVVRESVIRTFFRLDHHSIAKLSISNFKNIVLTESNFFYAYINASIFLISDVIFIVFLVIVLLSTMGLSLILVILPVGSLLVIFIFYYKTAISTASEERTASSESLTRLTGEIFTNYESIQVFGGVNLAIRDFLKAASRFASASIDFLEFPISFRLFVESFLLFGLTLLMYFYQTDLSVETFLLFFSASLRTAPVFVRIFNSVNSLLYYHGSIRKMQQDWKLSADVEDQKPVSLNEFSLVKVCIGNKGEYELPYLSDKSFDFEKNRHYVITGASGSGKSTLIKMLLGFDVGFDYMLRVDDLVIDKYNKSRWWHLVGYVPQDDYIYDGSLYSNVTLDFELKNTEINTSKVISLMVGLGLTAENGFHYELDGRLGEQGSLISGGQKQRICIARALFKNPKILIIDEGFSALDVTTVKQVRDFVNNYINLGTIIEVSHDQAMANDGKITKVNLN